MKSFSSNMNLSQKAHCADAFRHFQSGDNRMAQIECCYAGVEFEAAKRVYDEAADMGRFVERMEREFVGGVSNA